MASAPIPNSRLTRDQIVHNVKLAVGALVTAALGGLFAAVFTYYATVQVNTEASLQQQYLSAIQDFSATGAKVDEYVQGLATLRLLVDDTNGKINALKTSNARFDLMDNRVVMINEARRRVYDRT